MTKKKQSPIEKLSYQAIKWLGTTRALTVHTIFFLVAFVLVPFLGFDRVMLAVTTVVSLEAIYLTLFVQMSVNRGNKKLSGIEEDLDEILEDTASLTDEQKEEIRSVVKLHKIRE